MPRSAAWTAGAVLLAASCAGPVAPSDPASVAIRCSDSIDDRAALTDGYTVVADTVAVQVGVVLGTAPSGADGAGALYAKSGLLVRPGTVAELHVDAPARIGWGSPARTSTTVAVPSCPGSGTHWLAFAGGYRVDAPTCLRMTVRSAAARAEVEIAVGRAC